VLAGMLLPSGTRQRRALCRIEKMLLRDDPGLGSLFAFFTRLTLHEAMPWTEQARPVRWQWRKLVIAARAGRCPGRAGIQPAGLQVAHVRRGSHGRAAPVSEPGGQLLTRPAADVGRPLIRP